MLAALLALLKDAMAEKPIRLGVGIVLILGLALGGWKYLYWEPERQVISTQQANAALEAKMAEFARHLSEPYTEVVVKAEGTQHLAVRTYASDWCAFLVLTAGTKQRSQLVLDLARDEHADHFLFDPFAVLAAEPGTCPGHPPGPFARSWWGERSGACLVRQYWLWHDGCVLTQWVDTCEGTFAGPPYWTTCNH